MARPHPHLPALHPALPAPALPACLQVSNKAALGLVQRFVHNQREFDGTPTRDRLKIIPRTVNVAEWAKKGPLSGATRVCMRRVRADCVCCSVCVKWREGESGGCAPTVPTRH